MSQTKSLRAEILERLHLKKGGQKTASRNISKATKDFAKSDAPQFRGKSQKKRHEMGVAAGLSAARGENAERDGAALTENVTKGATMLYRGKPVQVQALVETTGMALVKMPRRAEPVYVRASDLGKTELTEAFLGMAPIGYTYVEPRRSDMIRLETLSAADIGLLETDRVDPNFGDDQEENTDNGSNVRHDGHTGKSEVDALPTPSDTIAPAYSDKIPPKQEGTPLSIEKGAEPSKLWTMPDFDGYDYPADAPDIPTAEFGGSDMGNPRAPHFSDDDGPEDEVKEEFDHSNPIFKQKQFKKKGEKPKAEGDAPPPGYEPKQESYQRVSRDGFKFVTEMGPNLGGMGPQGMGAAMDKYPEGYFDAPAGPSGQSGVFPNPARSAAPLPGAATPFDPAQNIGTHMTKPGPDSGKPMTFQGYGVGGGAFAGGPQEPAAAPLPQVPQHGPNLESRVMANYKALLAEMGDMLGGNEHEPKPGDTITLTLPAMASVLCTVASKVHDPSMMKAMIEAMAEVSNGKTIDMPDLEAVAAHINGEEAQEVENREAGRPEHEGIDDSGDGDEYHGGGFEPATGDGERAENGKTKLFGGGSVSGSDENDGDEEVPESFDYYGFDDIVRESEMSEEDEIRLIKKRAGFRYW